MAHPARQKKAFRLVAGPLSMSINSERSAAGDSGMFFTNDLEAG
jgi:hypothetical protein